MNHIPVELEEDPVLRQYSCSITLRPIRHIVVDPTSGNRVFYERSAIEAWLRTNETSPTTRLLLFRSQLAPCVPIQSIIDERLGLYSQRIQAVINQIHAEPFDQVAINDANAIVRGL